MVITPLPPSRTLMTKNGPFTSIWLSRTSYLAQVGITIEYVGHSSVDPFMSSSKCVNYQNVFHDRFPMMSKRKVKGRAFFPSTVHFLLLLALSIIVRKRKTLLKLIKATSMFIMLIIALYWFAVDYVRLRQKVRRLNQLARFCRFMSTQTDFRIDS